MPRRSKNTRRNKKPANSKIASRVYAPVAFGLNATGHIAKGIGNTAGTVVNHGLKGVRKIGNSVANSANKMINAVVNKSPTRRRRRN